MTRYRLFVRVGLCAVAMLGAALHADASSFTIGNAPATTLYFIQGQSFVPSVQGNDGLGTPAAGPGGTVLLTSFSFDFAADAFGTPSPVLYIYTAPPTPAAAATGAGSIGTGTHVGGGVYNFSNLLLTFNTQYYAILPEQRSIYDGPNDIYTGGADLFALGGLVQGNYGDYDAGFNATFSAVPEPATLSLLAMGLLGTGAFARGRARARRHS